MKLRVRTSSGVSDLEVDPLTTFAQLKAHLQAASLRSGFPPKTIQASDTDRISSLLANGDFLIVQPADSAMTRSSNRSPKSATHSKTPASSETSILSNGSLTIRVVPDDNSCLFRSVAGILGQTCTSTAHLRTIVRNAIAADPELYSEVFLGKSNLAYQQWIMSENAWGGAIELSIFAQHFKMEFAAFDVKTMRLDRYGEGRSYGIVGYLVYDGIHYNYIALAICGGAGQDADVTQFNVNDHIVTQHVRSLIQKENDSKRFTDTTTFFLHCGQCGAKLRGETQALEHAKHTGHTQFSEN